MSRGGIPGRSLSGPPDHETPVPATARRLVGGDPMVPVWRNQLGGVTWRVGDDRYLKWAPAESGISFVDEIARLEWASPYIVVPRVLDAGASDDGEWLLTVAIPGENAVSARWKREPRAAARAIGQGLRAMHELMPFAECPFEWSVAERRRRMTEATQQLPTEPPVGQLVVCHGDACAPNTLLADDGTVAGHVDLGRLGVADRWADIAVATYSLGWNYGDGFECDLLDAYGIEPDDERIAFYRALWDAT